VPLCIVAAAFRFKPVLGLLLLVSLLAPFSLKGLAQHEGAKTAVDLCQWLNGGSRMPSYVTAGAQTRALLDDMRLRGRPVTCVVGATALPERAWTETAILLHSPHSQALGLRVAPLGRRAEIRGYFTP